MIRKMLAGAAAAAAASTVLIAFPVGAGQIHSIETSDTPGPATQRGGNPFALRQGRSDAPAICAPGDDGAPTGVASAVCQETTSAYREIASIVPEPAAWAMLVTGFGLAGALMRLRRARMAM